MSSVEKVLRHEASPAEARGFREKKVATSTQELFSCVPKLLVLPSRLTPMFLVQFPVPLDFNLFFMVILDLDLGAPGPWGRASIGLSLWLPLPSVPQTPRVGRNYNKFLSAKCGSPLAAT